MTTKHVTVKFTMSGNTPLQDIVAALELIGAKTDSISVDIKTEHGAKPPARRAQHPELVYIDGPDGKSRIDTIASMEKLGVNKAQLYATITHKGTALHALKVALANSSNGHA